MKTIFFVCTFIFIRTFAIAQPASEEDVKKALKQIWVTQMTGNFQEPAGYLKDGSGKIIGQLFLNYGYKKYDTLKLTEAPTKAKSNSYDVDLQWKGTDITAVKIPDLYLFDYRVTVDGNGNVIQTDRVAVLNKISFKYLIEYDKVGRLSKISTIQTKKDPWIKEEKTFSYDGDVTNVKTVQYKDGKSNEPKNIYFELRRAYKKIDANTVMVTDEKGEKKTMGYDEQDRLVREKKESATGSEETIRSFSGTKIAREEKTTITNGEVVEKEVTIQIVKPGLPANAPEYEKAPGTYKFDKTGDLIYEVREGKYRKKVDGVWSDWQFFRM